MKIPKLGGVGGGGPPLGNFSHIIPFFSLTTILRGSENKETRNDGIFRFEDTQTGMLSTVPGGTNKRRKLDK